MPTNVVNTTSYAGEFAGKYIAAALLSANTIENGGVTVMPNVKYRSTVKTLSATGLVKDSTCDFDPTGEIALTDRVIEPKYLQVNATICKDEFEDDWEAIQMGYSAFDTLPNGEPTPDEKRNIERRFTERFSGSDGKKFILSFVQDINGIYFLFLSEQDEVDIAQTEYAPLLQIPLSPYVAPPTPPFPPIN